MFELARDNLMSPPILGFLLGLFARLVKSDLRLPDQLYQGLAIYLLFAIGLKGGAQLSSEDIGVLVMPILATFLLGILTPIITFYISGAVLKTSRANKAALAAHYGSVSAVTFIVALQFLTHEKISSESYFPALVAILEIVGIVIAIFFAQSGRKQRKVLPILYQALTGKSVLILIGAFLIGWLSGKRGVDPLAPLFIESFQGLLTLFLIQMGILAAERLSEIKRNAGHLIFFAILVPVIQGCLGLVLARWVQMSEGGSLLFAIMAASASYIAAPAAVRAAIPQANASYYVTASLGITLPFNLTIGIPLFYGLAQWLYSIQ